MRSIAPRVRHRVRHRARPEPQPLEGRALRSGFTMTSPTGAGALPAEVSPVGGIVLDLVGENGRRVVSQVGAGRLFSGNFSDGTPAEFRGNPGTIGVRGGFTPAVLDALGGGLAELGVRLTVFDGDSGPGDFDRLDNTLLLNGIPVGRFDAVPTAETDASGTVLRSENPDGGFRDDRLDTGFFHVTDPEILARVFRSIRDGGAVAVQLGDEDPFDNVFDFTLGVDASLIDVDLPPAPRNEPPRIDAITLEAPASEGSPFRVFVSASDPDPGDMLSYEFTVEGVDGVQIDASPSSPEALVTVPRDGAITLLVRVLDPLGSSDGTARPIVVRNVAPAVAPPGGRDAVEGSELPFALGSFDDPGLEDGWSVVVDWGDGSPADAFRVGRPGPLPIGLHRFAQDGEYVITIAVDDGEGSSSSSAVVRVRNAPPGIDRIEADRRVDLGSPVTLSATVSDPGARDLLEARIDWGDGTSSTVELAEGSGSVRAIRSYDRPGSYAITFTVSDERGAASTVALPVEVEAPPAPAPRIDPASPLSVGDEALAAALLPAGPGGPDASPPGPGTALAPGPPMPATIPPAPRGAPIGTLVGPPGAGPAPRDSAPPPPAVAPPPSSPADDAEAGPSQPPSEVASAEAEAAEAAAISSLSADDPPSTDPDAHESPGVDGSVAVAAEDAGGGAAPPPTSPASPAPAGAEGDDPDARAMRATVVLIAVLTIRRGGSRLRQSRSPGARRRSSR